MTRHKISYEAFRELACEPISDSVEDSHLGVMGATYIIRYICKTGGVVEERGGNGGCDYFLEQGE